MESDTTVGKGSLGPNTLTNIIFVSHRRKLQSGFPHEPAACPSVPSGHEQQSDQTAIFTLEPTGSDQILRPSEESALSNYKG